MPGSTPSSATTMTAAAEHPGTRGAAMDATLLLRRYAKPLIALAIAVADGVVIWRFGVAPGMLLLCAAAMLLVVTLLFRAVQALTGELDEEDEADLARVPTAAEEQKRAAIQALKDLEYERTVGKISKEDYDVLIARYRAEAKRLMRTVDDERAALRGEAEQIAAEAVREALGEPAEDRSGDTLAASPKGKTSRPPATGSAEEAPARVACPKCDTKNDADAAFCKKCGHRLGAEPAREEA